MTVIRLKRGTTEPTAADLVTGELAINTSDGSVYTITDAGDVVSIKGSTATALVATVRNGTGATLTKGTVVYITGASGNKPLVGKAQANAESTSARTYGILQADILTNHNGTAVLAGLLSGLDTSSYAEGTQLYLSPTVAGGIATTKPSAPNHIVYIGVISRSHANQGQIEVHISNGFELEELHNVSISSVANNNLLSYESSTSLWKNKTFAQLGLATLASPTFTGSPIAPTQTTSTSGNTIANLSYVYNAIQAYAVTPTSQGFSVGPESYITLTNNLIAQISMTEGVEYGSVNFNYGSMSGVSVATVIQVSDGKIIFPPSSHLPRWDARAMTAGTNAVVEIKKIGGSIYISGDLTFYPYGYTLFNACVENVDLMDNYGNLWTGYFTHREVVADGNGGEITTDNPNSNGCWHPYGFNYSYEQTDVQSFNWVAYDNLGNDIGNGIFNYSYSYTSTFADGSGGSTSTGETYGASAGDEIYTTSYWDSAGQQYIYIRVLYNGYASYYQEQYTI
jgi:hypothetical protein